MCQDVLHCDTVLVVHHTDCGAHAALFHPASADEHAAAKADELLGTQTGGEPTHARAGRECLSKHPGVSFAAGRGGPRHRGGGAADRHRCGDGARASPCCDWQVGCCRAGINMRPIYGLDASVRDDVAALRRCDRIKPSTGA